MELLFIWANQSDRKFIQGEGFNFSPEHHFEIVFKNGFYFLHYTKNNAINIFANKADRNVLSNLTAVVGKNGAGKSSLLKYIYQTIIPIPVRKNDDKNYTKYYSEIIEEHKSVFIFRDEANVFHVHYYLDDSELQMNEMPGFRFYNLNLDCHNINSNSIYNAYTTVYLSNSYYNNDMDGFLSERAVLSKCVLTTSSLRILSKAFYDKITTINDAERSKKYRFAWMQNIIKPTKTETDFQQICDILFFDKLIKSNKIESYNAKVCTDVSVDFQCLFNHVRNYLESFESNNMTKDANASHLNTLVEFVNNKLKNCSHSARFFNLYLSLYIEFLFIYGDSTNLEMINPFKDYNEFKQSLICQISNLKKQSDKVSNYLVRALNEIQDFENQFEFEQEVENILPLYDGASKRGIVFTYPNKGYKKLLSFIRKSFDTGNSFLLKYIQIQNLKMSSGERAFQNFFSWLNLLSDFNKISENVQIPLRRNMLLLIDEIDLYLHPEWQRNIIIFLIDELNNQFSGHNVQVICATHSPIVLSDIPLANTIYLSNKTDKLSLDDNQNHKETFSSNIYQILNDGFYLDNAMGAYSEKVINNLIKFIHDYRRDSQNANKTKIEYYKKVIEIIGEPIIKEKLSEMLDETTNSNNELEYLLKEKQMIEQRIKKLKSGGINDSDY